MNLRKFRRATAKKQILDNMAKCSSKLNLNHQVTEQKSDIMLFKSDAETTGKTRKRKLSGNENIEVTKTYDITKDSRNDSLSDKDDLKCQKLLPKYSKVINNNQNIDIRSEQPKVEAIREDMIISDDSDDQCTKIKIRTITENSENSSMTLQQFTDIVLASEGMSMAKNGKKSENTSPATPSTPQRKDSLQSSCGGDDEASNSIPTNFSSVLERKVSTESVNKISCCDTTKIVSSNLKSPSNNVKCNVKLEQMDNGYGCNNNILDSSTHNAMVANIMNNKDLTVEVKPIHVKPVVLSPRHPHGHNYNFQVNTRHYQNGEICSNNNNPWHSKSGQHSSLPSNGRYYSSAARPRIQRYDSDNSSCSVDIFESKSSPLPKGRPPSIPKMVEEWFKKMQPPQMEEDDNHYDGHLDNATSDKSFVHANQSQPVPRKHQLILREPPEIRTNTATVFQTDSDSNTVLNLSTKDCKKNLDLKVDKKQQNPVQKSSNISEIRDSNPLRISKPTQVYLRPIPTNQMTHNSTTNTTTPTLPKSHLPHSGKQQILALHDQGLKPRRPEYEQIVILGRHNRKEQYSSDQNRRYCNPVEGSRPNTNQTNVNYYHKLHPGLPAVVKNGTTSVNNNINPADNSRQILSPPNLEITRIPSYPKHSPTDVQPSLPIDRITRNLNDFNLPNPIMPNNKNLGRSFTLEPSNAHRESIKARAIRDIQLAHTKDLHGN